MEPREIMEALQAPFDPSDVEWRVSRTVKTNNGCKAIVLAYVTNRAIQNRLDDIFGPFSWKNEFKEWRDKGTICGISVLWNGEWITKWDGSDETNFEATKGGFSGSMKRAAVQFGIGRYLYNLDETWVDIKDRGENYINTKVKVGNSEEWIKGYWDTPKLPGWALPPGKASTDKQQIEPAEKPSEKPTDNDLSIAKRSSIKAKLQIHKDLLDGSKFLSFVESQLQCKFEDMGLSDLQKVAEALEGAIQKKLEKKGA